MNFEKFFRSISYAAVFCGFFSLWVTGSFGPLESAIFILIMTAAWFLEGSRWLLSERIGTALIVLALPAAYLSYRYGLFAMYGADTVIAGVLARMILALSAIKLLQRKSDRDWIFLYLMSFFEVLLAAGLSISLLYLSSFLVYLLVMVCAVIAFEMRRTSRVVEERISGGIEKTEAAEPRTTVGLRLRKLPSAAVILIVLIAVVAMPLFFMLPRVGGAGLGSFGNGLSTQTGFSDKVTLGGIGRLQQNDAVVMRVRLDESSVPQGDLYFKGVALDTFDNRTWTRSKQGVREPFVSGERDLFQLDYASGKDNLLLQNIYLEPLDTPVLFAVPKAVAIQGNFPVIYKDRYGAISFQPNGERSNYRVFSDTAVPSAERLRADMQAYGTEYSGYLQIPEIFDGRITELAARVTSDSKNRYDKALAVERFLRRSYGYTLELKAGGDEPVADFLFNVKEGHCELFASAMAMMLRTQGIATRIVNGFHTAEFNDSAGMYIVRQRHAHAWVEVYFPKENTWVRFDPTPADPGGGAATGIMARAAKYLEALDAIWIQYFVAFDNQEQRTLAVNMRRGFVDYQAKTASFLGRVQESITEWWNEARGVKGPEASVSAIAYAAAAVVGSIVAAIFLVWLYRRISGLSIWRRIRMRLSFRPSGSIIKFYERMQQILAEKGFVRPAYQTPLEFAYSVGMLEAVRITEIYNGVRFGKRDLKNKEAEEIEQWLSRLSEAEIERCKEK